MIRRPNLNLSCRSLSIDLTTGAGLPSIAVMDMSTVVAWYGSKAAVARALGVSAVAVTRWKDDVPPLRQLQLERMTKGALRADDSILDRPAQKGA